MDGFFGSFRPKTASKETPPENSRLVHLKITSFFEKVKSSEPNIHEFGLGFQHVNFPR